MSGKNISKNQEASLAVHLAAGAQSHFANIAQLMIGSGSFTTPQVVTQLNAFAKLRNDVESAKATVRALLVDESTQGPPLRAFMIAFIAVVMGAFGNSPDILADFGLPPKKVRAPLTVAQKAAAAAKRKATRAARGTMGAKAKLSVKGNVTGVDIVPVTAPAAAGAPQHGA